MKTKSFILLLVGIVLVGGAIGGAFLGGEVMGKRSERNALAQTAQNRVAQFGTGNFTRQVGGGGAAPGGGRIPGGGFVGGAGGLVGGGAGFGGGAAGTVQSVSGNTVTLTTQNGSTLIVILSSNTAIEKISAGTNADLTPGSNITVGGPRNPDGSVQAATVLLNQAR